MITNENIARHELIGLTVSIVNAADKSRIGTCGIVTDETKNTLTIKDSITAKEKKIPKKECMFRFQIEKEEVDVDGLLIVYNPADRTKKIKSGRRKYER